MLPTNDVIDIRPADLYCMDNELIVGVRCCRSNRNKTELIFFEI